MACINTDYLQPWYKYKEITLTKNATGAKGESA